MRTCIIIFTLIFLSACTSQFAYRHLDWVIAWYADDYLDLNYDQEKAFEGKLKNTLHWHQHEELPKYKEQLINLSRDINSLPISTGKVQEYVGTIIGYWENVRTQASHDFSPLLSSLNSEQITYLFNKIEKRNIKRLDTIKNESPSDRKEDSIEKWEDILIEHLGDINTVQYSLLKSYIENKKDTTELRVEYLRYYQMQVKQAMEERINPETLAVLLDNPEAFKSDQYVILQRENRLLTYRFFSDLSVHMTPNQLEHLNDKIHEYINFINKITHQ